MGNELAFAGVSPSAVNKVSKKTVVYKSLFKNSGINISWSSVSKPKFIDETLRKFANQLYRDGAVIGNRSTADAIRYIKKTGELVGNSDHVQKGVDSVRFLEKWLENNKKANGSDISSVKKIINDINSALKGN